MTKKDYILLAECLHAAREAIKETDYKYDAIAALEILETHMGAELYNQNQSFDHSKWYKACRVGK